MIRTHSEPVILSEFGAARKAGRDEESKDPEDATVLLAVEMLFTGRQGRSFSSNLTLYKKILTRRNLRTRGRRLLLQRLLFPCRDSEWL
jgi:hypothetical protein